MSAENSTSSLVFQIDQLLDEASNLARSDHDSARFFKTLLQRAVLAVQARSAGIWMLGPDSHPVAVSAHKPLQLAINSKQSQSEIDQTIRQCIGSGQSKHLTTSSMSLSMFCSPYNSGSGSTDAAVTLFFDQRDDLELASVYSSFTEAIAEIAADHGSWVNSQNTNKSPEKRSSNEPGTTSEWNKFKSLSDALHENLDIHSTAISLVNLGRNFYSCDRVSLAKKSGSNFKIIAVSGVAKVNRKSETVSAIESLVAKGFRRNDKPVVLHESNPVPDRMEDALEKYRSVSAYQFLLLSPIPDQQGRVKFVQVIESAERNDVGKILKRVKIAEPQTKSAFKNALQYQSIPLRGLLGALGGSSIGSVLGRLFIPLAFFALAAITCAVLCLIQTELVVSADGNIVAETEKSIFAAREGVITSLSVEHGEQVSAHQLLIEMSSRELESKLSLIQGELETEKKRLSAIEAVKSSLDRGSREGQRELGRLSSQEIESRQQIENLQVEFSQLEGEKEKLQLRSPLDGMVVTRDAKTNLLNRPVDRGDFLLRLVANDGKWLAKIRVPDSRIAHLMKLAPEDSNAEDRPEWEIPVTLSIATYPEKKFSGRIHNVSNTAEIDESTRQAFILVTVEVEHEEEFSFQSGSSVIAEFNCGKSSIGYAWFNEFIDSVRYRFF